MIERGQALNRHAQRVSREPGRGGEILRQAAQAPGQQRRVDRLPRQGDAHLVVHRDIPGGQHVQARQNPLAGRAVRRPEHRGAHLRKGALEFLSGRSALTNVCIHDLPRARRLRARGRAVQRPKLRDGALQGLLHVARGHGGLEQVAGQVLVDDAVDRGKVLQAGHDDDARAPGQPPDAGDQLLAAQSGHAQVGNQQIGHALFTVRPGGQPVRKALGRTDPQPFPVHARRDAGQNQRFVLCDCGGVHPSPSLQVFLSL